MKKWFVFFALVGIFLNSFAQNKPLGALSDIEKGNIQKGLRAYIAYLNAMSEAVSQEQKKNLSIPFMRDQLAKGMDVMGFNEFDSSRNAEPIKILAYAYGLNGLNKKQLAHSLDEFQLQFREKEYDPWRRIYLIETKAVKSVKWAEIIISKKILIDSMASKADTVSVQDTIWREIKSDLIFLFRFEVENNSSSGFKLAGVYKDGLTPVLPSLGKLQQWWIQLPQEWKDFLLTQRKLEEFPRESDLERLIYISELNLERSNFARYEPLTVFTNLKKINLNGSSINSLEYLKNMKQLTVLDVSKSKITSLDSIGYFPKLEEFYAVGLGLKKCNSLSQSVSLLKLDLSENDLDSIDALSSLVLLKELAISLNIRIKNIDAVKGMVYMEKLAFRKIEIKDLTPLKGMTNLVYLDCYNTGITSLEPIRNLNKIFHLDLSNNKVTSLEPIKDYRFIINLYLNSSSIADLSVVDNFSLLRELEIAGCPQIKSLGGIHKLEYVKVLKCFHTGIGKDEVQRFKKNHPNCAITYY